MTAAKRNPEAFVLYRFFDADGGLLYVGQSIDAWARLTSHRRYSGFYPEVANVTLERGFDSAEALTEAEVKAIRTEEPKCNVMHSKTRPEPKPKTFPHHFSDALYNVSGTLRHNRREELPTRLAELEALTTSDDAIGYRGFIDRTLDTYAAWLSEAINKGYAVACANQETDWERSKARPGPTHLWASARMCWECFEVHRPESPDEVRPVGEDRFIVVHVCAGRPALT